MSRPLVLIAWNCYVANSDFDVQSQLQSWADIYQPDAFALSEARTHYDATRLPGYARLQQPPTHQTPRGVAVNDQGDSALLVAEHVDVRHRSRAQMRRRWTVASHHNVHTPRIYEQARLRVGGHTWRVRASHWPTNGFEGNNAAAFLESARRSRRWLRAGLKSTSLDVGDLNDDLTTIAEWFGPRYQVAGQGIDLLVARRAGRIEHAQLEKGGSDHHGQLYRVWPA